MFFPSKGSIKKNIISTTDRVLIIFLNTLLTINVNIGFNVLFFILLTLTFSELPLSLLRGHLTYFL